MLYVRMHVCMYVYIFVQLCIYVRRHAGILFSNFNLTPAARFRCQDIQFGFLMYKMAVVDISLHNYVSFSHLPSVIHRMQSRHRERR